MNFYKVYVKCIQFAVVGLQRAGLKNIFEEAMFEQKKVQKTKSDVPEIEFF